jgi:DnaJ-class molecular chaperone
MQPSEEAAVSYTYYDYLELSPGASPARIESAFLALLERFGYGTNDTGQDMSGLIAMVHDAYRVLSNPEARERYDATLAREAAMADAELKATLDQHVAGARQREQVAVDVFEDTLAAMAA